MGLESAVNVELLKVTNLAKDSLTMLTMIVREMTLMTNWQATAALILISAIFTYAIWSHGNVIYDLKAENKQLRSEQHTIINSLADEQDKARACGTALGYLIGDTEKYAITRQELRACRMELGVIKR